MNYDLTIKHKSKTTEAFRKMLVFMKGEKKQLTLAFVVMLVNSGLSLFTPFLIGYTIDHYIVTKNYDGLLTFCALIFCIYILSSFTEYFQTKVMGSIGQRMLYSLRNALFNKVQSLPVAFFNQNKAGDLISRINNDTQTVNQFFSQSLMQFVDSIFMMAVAAIFMLALQPNLGAAGLAPGVLILIFVKLINPWVKNKNAATMAKSGLLSAEIQESLSNFRTILAFNRRDFFRKKFEQANTENFKASVVSGFANATYAPVFTLFSNIAQLIVLAYGIYLISIGDFTLGILISYIAYVQSFYRPLRQIATLWASFQTAMASWDRISVILNLKSNMEVEKQAQTNTLKTAPLLQFENVSFQYPNGKQVLENIHIELHKGKTYAFVGPTGGGKTTTASLIARLYDPNEGTISLDGIPLKDYDAATLSSKIGFILQEPFLFNGTLKDNIIYGNTNMKNISDEALMRLLNEEGFGKLIQKFENGLQSKISGEGESMSLGEKQIIAFMRAVLRRPELLILDEATANIDTITEMQLQEILDRLPEETTKVIIAHRLNTIANADQIFFVNAQRIDNAGDINHALQLLTEHKRES